MRRKDAPSNRKGKKWSEETRIKMNGVNEGDRHPLFGKHHSEKTKIKMRKPRYKGFKQLMSIISLNNGSKPPSRLGYKKLKVS